MMNYRYVTHYIPNFRETNAISRVVFIPIITIKRSSRASLLLS